MLKHLKQISSKLVSDNPYWSYWLDRYLMPNGKEADYHYVNSLGSTMIIPVMENGDLLLTKQYRYLNQKVSLEFPGGGIEKGLTPIENARKELEEETNYTAGSLVKVAEFNPFNGVTNEICHLFVAKDLRLCKSKSKLEADESEEISILAFSPSQLTKVIQSNELWDGMTMASLAYYNTYLRINI